MSEAPERIRVWPDYDDHFSPARHDWTGGIWDDTDDASGIEYIRADLSQAAVEALEAKLAKAKHIVRILASAEWEDRLGEAVDLACAYLAEENEG